MRRRLLLATLAALAAAPGAARAAGEPGEAPRPIYVEIDRIVVSVFKGAEVVNLVMLTFRLELAEDGAIAPVLDKMPRLRDAFVRDWNALGARHDAAEKGLDVEAGRRRMLAACERILGPGAVRNVLLQGVSQRRVQAR
jgi:flagellar basal body-associated protein FliL